MRMRIPLFIPLVSMAILTAATATADLANGVKAIVGNTVITYQQVEASASRAVELLRRQYATRPELYQKKLTETLNDALEDLVQRQLILHDFKASGFTLPESVTEEGVQERIHQRFGDRATLTKTLAAEHLTFETFRQQIKEQIIIDAMRGKYVSSGVIISPLKIENYYTAHQDEFKEEDQIRLRMIVLDTTAAPTPEARKKLAEEILGKIKDGATFSEMAAVYSTGSQRNQGGDWGWVQRSVLRQELADTAFTLKAGERSNVIETPDACYLMLVEETRPTHIKPLGDVRDEVEKTLQAQERAKVQKDWIDRLKKKTFVRYF
jgi:parvulin-like peptidyl-prolyl isomerase